ncbi:MAG: hypothetical protein OXC28_25975 [Defluviicoccus sp.]|nr:hypothetical protein [Defluviicoccus sp.]
MLIGNRNSFAVGIEPLSPSWERRFPPEFTAWARLSLWINGENICRNLLDGSDSVREGVNVPLAPIADWLVRSWTFLEFEERPSGFPLGISSRNTVRRWGDSLPPAEFGEDDWLDTRELWWSRHFLAAGADGAHLPNVSLIRGGDRLFIEWAQADFAGSPAPRFLSVDGRQTIGWSEGEETLSDFVSFVARWLRDSELDDVYPWVSREDPLHEAIPDFSGALQAYTGIPADVLRGRTGSHDDAELRQKLGLHADERDPGGSVITQVLRGLPPRISDTVWDLVWRLDGESQSATGFAEELRALALDAVRPASDPETSGYLAAQGLRDYLGLNGQPIGDVDRQLREVGVNLIDSNVKCTHERMLAGSRRGCGAAAIINRTPRTSTPWGRRFESIRALGHLLLDPYRQDALGAASTAFAQPWARRRAGTFAAEFLLPSEALGEDAHGLDSYAEPERFLNVLVRYGVGAQTAAYHLWNRGFLSSTQVRDDLIDQFSNVEPQ